MNTRAIVIFLAVNCVISVAVGYKFFTNENKTDTKTQLKPVPAVVKQEFPMPQAAALTPVAEKDNQKKSELIAQPITVNNFLNQGATDGAPLPVISNNTKPPVLVTVQSQDVNQVSQKSITQEKNIIPTKSSELPEAFTPHDEAEEVNPNICTVLGPLDFDAKNSLELILKNSPQHKQLKYHTEEKPVFEVYWNLGKDREEAEELLQKQKLNGTMSDSRFMIIQNEVGDWIVPIIEVNSNIDVAKATANTLAAAANKNNAGGKWQYRTKPTAYFYTVENFEILDKKALKSIDVMLDTPKQPCTTK